MDVFLQVFQVQVVLESPVQSSFLAQKKRLRPRLVQTFPKTKKTRPGPKKTRTKKDQDCGLFGLFWSLDWSWSKPGFSWFRPVF